MVNKYPVYAFEKKMFIVADREKAKKIAEQFNLLTKNSDAYIGEEINMLKLQVKRTSDKAILPVRANKTDSGLDLFASEEVIIPARSTKVIPTSLIINIQEGYEGQIRNKSGVTTKTPLRVQLGTIDESYCGEDDEIGIIVDNISDDDYKVAYGQKIAQLVVTAVELPEVQEVAEIKADSRGGFGSTGAFAEEVANEAKAIEEGKEVAREEEYDFAKDDRPTGIKQEAIDAHRAETLEDDNIKYLSVPMNEYINLKNIEAKYEKLRTFLEDETGTSID